jgi:pyruvate dehydrogenase E2 component (dihydrolipoamide acetyltransferase)
MAKDINIPKLNFSMREARIIEWKAKEGERVEASQIVLMIETDKVTVEVEAPISGFLHILAEENDVIPVATPVGQVAETKEELAELKEKVTLPTVENEEERVPPLKAMPASALSKTKKKVKVSPAARKIADAYEIDLSALTGSGPQGRIVREDVEKAIKRQETNRAAKEDKVKEVPGADVYEGKTVKKTIALQGMRKAIAEHMYRSLSSSAQLSGFFEVDVTELIDLRKGYMKQEEELGVRITLTDMLVAIIAKALENNPLLNASLINQEIRIWEEINIGIAVALEIGEYESGLIVPVVKQANQKSLVQISKEINELVDKAQQNKLTLQEVTGGTFTLSNAGVFGKGGIASTAIINHQEVAILQSGPITDKPVVRGGEITIRPIMSFCITWDHRVLDGAPIAKFIGELIDAIEAPQIQRLK